MVLVRLLYCSVRSVKLEVRGVDPNFRKMGPKQHRLDTLHMVGHPYGRGGGGGSVNMRIQYQYGGIVMADYFCIPDPRLGPLVQPRAREFVFPEGWLKTDQYLLR